MLIVVKDGYVHFFLELLFDVEAMWRGNIFKVDGAKRRSYRFDDAYNFIRILRRENEWDSVNISEFFHKDGFPFHDRQSGKPSDIS